MNKYPDKETLRAMVRSGEVVDGYLMVAACYYQLVEDGAQFWVDSYQITFSLPGVCGKCAQSLPYEEWKANYYIDIVTPNIVSNE